MMRKLFLLPLLMLGACASGTAQEWHQPDNTIVVAPDAAGNLQAIGPQCAPYTDDLVDQYANDPLPQLGCATANNLAAMVANPADLVRGELPKRRDRGTVGGVDADALSRYELGKAYPPVSYSTGSGGATAAQ